jgi:hypothetical protein
MVLSGFSAKYNVVTIRAKNLHESKFIEFLGCVDQRISSLLWSVKFLWAGGSGSDCSRRFCRRGLLARG